MEVVGEDVHLGEVEGFEFYFYFNGRNFNNTIIFQKLRGMRCSVRVNDDEKFLFAWGLVISEYKIDGYLVGSRCGQNFYSSLIIVVCGCCKRSGKC